MSFAKYKPIEIYRLKTHLEDNGYRRLRQFFFGVNRDPSAVVACELIKGYFFNYVQQYSHYFLTDLDRSSSSSSNYDWFSMIFTIPYEDLPLYIGSKNKMHRVVAAWRLELGK